MAKEYNIAKTSGLCVACGNGMTPQQEIVATVRETDEDLHREDYCLECWQKSPKDADPAVLGVWRTHVPQPQEKKRVFVDDELLASFFQRLEGSAEAAKVNFRFVLALILMRKKLLVYDRMRKLDDGTELWSMHFKGNPQAHEVVNPRMDEEKITQVSQQLGQILQGEL